MPSNYIPDEHHIVRYVPWSRLRKDENDNVIGVNAEAFCLRVGEEYLSASWLEYFSGCQNAATTAVIQCIRRSGLSPKPKSGFAIGCVSKIKGILPRKIRIIHEAEPDNEAHVAVRQWPAPDDIEILEAVAADAWNAVVLNSSVP